MLLRICFKPARVLRTAHLSFLCAAATPFSRTTTSSKSYPGRHTYHARTRIARRSYSGATALYGYPYSARVSPAIVLAARARENPGVISIHRSVPETHRARGLYGNNGGFIAKASITARVTPVISSPFLFFWRAFHPAQRRHWMPLR